jgi:hypothetical protein
MIAHPLPRLAILFIFASTFCIASAWSSDNAEGATGEIDAFWHAQQLQFQFRSYRTRYACDALERKVANILRAVGARDVAVHTGCMRHQFLNDVVVHVIVSVPELASEENVRRSTTFDGRERLIARVRNIALPTAADIERFPARWERVSLTRHRLVKLDAGDCDLLRSMSEGLFPKLSIQFDRNSMSCSMSATRLRPRFEVTALIPTPLAPFAYSGH